MLTLDRPQDALLNEHGVARGVGVRVRPDGPPADLPLGKTTIGSSPRCNIRVQQPGVQPLHCLILNQANSLSIRRWAGETLLNGKRIEESGIQSGDVVQVGSVELEFVAPEPNQPTVIHSDATPAASTPPLVADRLVPQVLVSPPLALAVPVPSIAPTPAQTDSKQYRVGRDLARSRNRQL